MDKFKSILLAIESILVVLDIIVGGNYKIGMICYWVLIAWYHILDFILNDITDDKHK